MNLFETIDEAMQADILEGNEDSEKKSDKLLGRYQGADAETKLILDDVFITLTGYSLKTLIGQSAPRPPSEDINLVDALEHVFGAENVIVFNDDE